MGLELEVLNQKLNRFGWDRMNEHVRSQIVSDWVDALQDFTLAEIKAAVKLVQREDPDSVFNEERIAAEVQKDRARRLAAIPKHPSPPDDARLPPSPDAKARIDAIVKGFTGKKQINTANERNEP